MTTQQIEENKATTRRFFEEIVNAKQLGVADEIFATDHTYHDPASPMIGPGPEGQEATDWHVHRRLP